MHEYLNINMLILNKQTHGTVLNFCKTYRVVRAISSTIGKQSGKINAP